MSPPQSEQKQNKSKPYEEGSLSLSLSLWLTNEAEAGAEEEEGGGGGGDHGVHFSPLVQVSAGEDPPDLRRLLFAFSLSFFLKCCRNFCPAVRFLVRTRENRISLFFGGGVLRSGASNLAWVDRFRGPNF